MEVQSSFDYSYPNYECYSALKDHVLPNLGIVYWYGYVPLGKINVKVVEEHEPAYYLKGKLQLRTYNLIPYTVGPELKFTCINTGSSLCTIEMASEATVYGNYLLNLAADLLNKMNPKFVRKRLPRIYFDKEVVYDKDTYLSASFRNDANFRVFKYVFKKANKLLDEYLRNKFSN